MHNIALHHEARQPQKSAGTRRKLKKTAAEEAQIAVPDAVDVPLPKDPIEEIAVPASINGRDLSKGRP